VKPIHFQGRDYIDDRMFIVELRKALMNDKNYHEKPWTLVTKRNVLGFPATRADDFETWDRAMEYLKHILPQTPLISLGGECPTTTPSYEQHLAWLDTQGLHRPYIHPDGKSRVSGKSVN